MSRRHNLFVYGTLQPLARTLMSRWLAQRTARSRAGSVPGRIVAVACGDGWFPALVPARSGARVVGTLCELLLAPGELARLDRYEGREYRRISARVRTDEGAVTAQVYLWRTALPADAMPVPTGDFLGWLEETRRRPFSSLRNCA